MTLDEMRNAYDWQAAFGYASNIRVAYGCSEKPFTLNDVKSVKATSEGENNGAAWLACGQLKDGRWFYLSAGCDYTGWDCQASGDAQVADTLKNLKQYAMDNEGRERLFGIRP